MANKFQIQQALDIVLGLIQKNPNHADFEFYKKLALELQQLLEEHDKEDT